MLFYFHWLRESEETGTGCKWPHTYAACGELESPPTFGNSFSSWSSTDLFRIRAIFCIGTWKRSERRNEKIDIIVRCENLKEDKTQKVFFSVREDQETFQTTKNIPRKATMASEKNCPKMPPTSDDDNDPGAAVPDLFDMPSPDTLPLPLLLLPLLGDELAAWPNETPTIPCAPVVGTLGKGLVFTAGAGFERLSVPETNELKSFEFVFLYKGQHIRS
jgi:hypothetical protein